MNYLGHLFVAGGDPSQIVGQLAADFVRPKEIGSYPSEIQTGIRRHQAVDGFTDRHPAFARSWRRFSPPYRRYGGILADLAYDHVLAKNWALYSPEFTLAAFTRRAYAVLVEHREVLPERLRLVLPRMIQEDWLGSYRDFDHLEWVLRGISRRLRHRNALSSAIGALRANQTGLEADFYAFFPDLESFAQRLERTRKSVASRDKVGLSSSLRPLSPPTGTLPLTLQPPRPSIG